MAWCALIDRYGDWLREGAVQSNRLFPTGCLMVQINLRDCPTGTTLMSFEGTQPWRRHISLSVNAKGNIEMQIGEGDKTTVSVENDFTSKADTNDLLLTYAWDAPGRSARLTISDSVGFLGQTKVIKTPPPLFQDDLLHLASTAGFGAITFCALSDTAEPIGPMPGIDLLTLIDTPSGPRCAGKIRTGDQILTVRGIQTVLARIQRDLPAAGVFSPIRLQARPHGLNRPLTVAAHQPLVFEGSDVEYTIGKPRVHIPASQLERHTEPDRQSSVKTYCQFLLPKPAGIHAQGVALASLNIGRLRRHSDDLRLSLLGNLPAGILPEHGDNFIPSFSGYDAQLLARGRTA